MKTRDSKPVDQVFETTNYDLFKIMDGNRPLNRLHLARLMESMRENPLFSAVIVNEKMELVDGQHRYTACKELGLPVRFVVQKGYGLSEVHRLNQNAKVWKAEDYLNSYCDLGLLDYKMYRTFKEKYGFGHYENLWMLTGTQDRENVKAFTEGTFKVKNFKSACNAADKIMALAPFYTNFMRRSFVHCMLSLLRNDEFDFDLFMQKLSKQPTAIRDAASTASYMEQVERIYNYHNRNKINLRIK